MPPYPGVGRPRAYCKDSHRVRAAEWRAETDKTVGHCVNCDSWVYESEPDVWRDSYGSRFCHRVFVDDQEVARIKHEGKPDEPEEATEERDEEVESQGGR